MIPNEQLLHLTSKCSNGGYECKLTCACACVRERSERVKGKEEEETYERKSIRDGVKKDK